MRFPEFSGEWMETVIGTILNIGSGRDYKHLKNGNVPVFGTGGLMTTVNEFLYDGETVCIGRKGTINKPFYYNGKIWTVDTLFFTYSFKAVTPKFVFSLFEQINWLKYNEASGVPSLSKSTIEQIDIFIPSLSEQKKIATFLSLIDERIGFQSKLIQVLESLIKETSQKLFSQQLRFKDDNGSDFCDWEVKKLRKVSEIFDGTHQTPNYVDDGIPFFSVEHLTANQFDKTKYISAEVYQKENKRVKLEKGDILMTRIGSIGVAKYINWDVKASFYVSLALIKKSNKINNEYLCHFINSDFFQSELWKRTIHVAFPQKINLGEIGECLVKIPALAEQTKIANFLSSIDEKIAIEKQLLIQYENQKKYLLQNLFV